MISDTFTIDNPALRYPSTSSKMLKSSSETLYNAENDSRAIRKQTENKDKTALFHDKTVSKAPENRTLTNSKKPAIPNQTKEVKAHLLCHMYCTCVRLYVLILVPLRTIYTRLVRKFLDTRILC